MTGSSAFDFVKSICDSLSINIQIIDEMTDAGLIGTDNVITDPETGEEKHEASGGVFGNPDVDIIYIDEGSVLFAKNPPAHSSKARTYIQKVLNPMGSATSKLVKQMAHVTIERTPTQSMYVVSFFPDTIDSIVIRTGYMQRSLTICKRMNLNDRKDNMFRDIDMQGIITDRSKMNNLLASFKELETFIKNNSKFTFASGTGELQKSYVDDALSTLTNTSSFLQEEGASFVQLYVGRHFPILSWHHACWRGSNVIEIEDVKYAYQIVLKPAFLDIVSWIEEKNEVARAAQQEQGQYNIFKEIYFDLLKNNECVYNGTFVPQSDLIESFEKKAGKSKRTAQRELAQLFEKGKLEKIVEGRSTYIKIK